MHAVCFAHLNDLDFITLIIHYNNKRLWNTSLWSILQPLVTSFTLGPKIFSTKFSNPTLNTILKLRSSLNQSHSHTKQQITLQWLVVCSNLRVFWYQMRRILRSMKKISQSNKYGTEHKSEQMISSTKVMKNNNTVSKER